MRVKLLADIHVVGMNPAEDVQSELIKIARPLFVVLFKIILFVVLIRLIFVVALVGYVVRVCSIRFFVGRVRMFLRISGQTRTAKKIGSASGTDSCSNEFMEEAGKRDQNMISL